MVGWLFSIIVTSEEEEAFSGVGDEFENEKWDFEMERSVYVGITVHGGRGCGSCAAV